MKKKLVIIMLTVFLLSIFSVSAFALSVGDVNGDGVVRAADARLALRCSARIEELTEEQFDAADVDRSGKVTAGDARQILRFAANIDKSFSYEYVGLLVEDGVLNVAVNSDSAPFVYKKKGKLVGADVELLERLAEKNGLELKLHDMPREDFAKSLENGECDIAMSGIVSKEELSKKYLVSTSYYRAQQGVAVKYASSLNVSEDVKTDGSMKFGVLTDSFAYHLFSRAPENGGLPANVVVKNYNRCADGHAALMKGEIDVFVTEDYFARCMAANGLDLKTLYHSYIDEEYVFIAAKDKNDLMKKLSLSLYYTKKDDVFNVYSEDLVDSTITAPVAEITIAPGSTALIPVKLDSFFGPSAIHVSCHEDGLFASYSDITMPDGTVKYYLSIYAYPDAQDATVTVMEGNHQENNHKIAVNVEKNKNVNYCFGFNSTCPDFGAFTGTSTYGYETDPAAGAIAFTYTSESLVYAGYTNTSQFQPYLDQFEKNGYQVVGAYEEGNMYMIAFYNEKTNEAAAYCEVYDEYGYLAGIVVSTTYNYNFY